MADTIDDYLKIELDKDELNTDVLESTFERLHDLGADFRLDVRLVSCVQSVYEAGNHGLFEQKG